MNTSLDMNTVFGLLTPQLLKIVGALIILLVGMWFAKAIRGLATKGLSKIKFLHFSSGDKIIDLAQPLATLIYYVVLLNVLLIVLAQLGLTTVLDPLKNMASQFLGYLPKIIGAGIVGYIGFMIARIFSDLSKVALAKVDEQVAAKLGSDAIQVSKFGSAMIFAMVLLPIVVAALGILDITAISVPATAMIEQLMSAIPKILAAVIIMVVSYAVTKFVVFILKSLLEGMNIDALPAKLGISSLFNDKFTPTCLITGAVFFFAMLAATVAAVGKLEIPLISAILAQVLTFGGKILVGGVILVIGNFLSLLAHDKLTQSGSTGLATVARIAILGLVLAMGLQSMGLADSIVNMAFGATIGAVAVATALAFGLGGRDAAKRIADAWADKFGK